MCFYLIVFGTFSKTCSLYMLQEVLRDLCGTLGREHHGACGEEQGLRDGKKEASGWLCYFSHRMYGLPGTREHNDGHRISKLTNPGCGRKAEEALSPRGV